MTMWVIIFMHGCYFIFKAWQCDSLFSVTNFTYMLLQKAWMSILSYIILQKDKSKCWDVHWVSNLITVCELTLVEVITLSVFLIVLFWVSVAADKDFVKALSKERFYELVILYFEGLLNCIYQMAYDTVHNLCFWFCWVTFPLWICWKVYISQ